MKKIFFIFCILLSAVAYGQTPNINKANYWTTATNRTQFGKADTFHIAASVPFDYVVQDKFGKKVLLSSTTFNPSIFLLKSDTASLTGYVPRNQLDSAKQNIRNQIAGISGSPGGSNTQVQYNNSSAFGGTSGATADATHLFVPTLYGGSGSGGALTLTSTSNAAKGLINIGSAATSFFDEVNNQLVLNKSALASVPTMGMRLLNNTASTVGTPVQHAASLEFSGTGYGTTAGTSQVVIAQINPQVQTSAVPSGDIRFRWSINGGAFTTPFTFSSDGTLTATGDLRGGNFLKGNGGSLFKMSIGTSQTVIYSEVANPISFQHPGQNQYALFNNTGNQLTDSIATAQTVIAGALLELKSSQLGFVMPRWTTTQKNNLPNKPKGVMGYDSTIGAPVWWDGAVWNTIGGATNIYNTDGSLTANRTLSGASFSLALGTSGSSLSSLSIFALGTSVSGGLYNNAGGSQLLLATSTINNAITAAAGTVTNFSASFFRTPTVTSTNAVNYSHPATLRIENSPTMGTNSTATNQTYALDVAAGISHFGVGASNISGIFEGSVAINAPVASSNIGLTLGASTSGLTAMQFQVGVDVTGGLLTQSGNVWYNGTNLYFVDGSSTGVARDVLNGLHNYRHTIFTPTTGGTVSTVINQYNIVNPAGALATLTVNLPSSPNNNDVVYIKYTQTVSAVTYANGTVVSPLTAPVAGGLLVLTYDSGTTSWY